LPRVTRAAVALSAGAVLRSQNLSGAASDHLTSLQSSPALAMGLEVADTVRAYADILRYLGDTMLYHHSIDTLAPAVNRDPRFASPLAGTVAGTSTM